MIDIQCNIALCISVVIAINLTTLQTNTHHTSTSSYQNSCTAITSHQDSCTATTSYQDSCMATTSHQDSCTATTSYQDSCTAITSHQDSCTSTTSHQDSCTATTSHQDSCTSTTSHQDSCTSTTSSRCAVFLACWRIPSAASGVPSLLLIEISASIVAAGDVWNSCCFGRGAVGGAESSQIHHHSIG